MTWDPSYTGTILKLTVDGRVYGPTRPGEYSPVLATFAVEAGKDYRIVIGMAGSDWLPDDRFVLTPSLAP